LHGLVGEKRFQGERPTNSRAPGYGPLPCSHQQSRIDGPAVPTNGQPTFFSPSQETTMLAYNDNETAPLGGGDKGPDPTPITNPNDQLKRSTSNRF
jgi:hypothetical protein